ncbi:glycosyltransferase family 4 protein [Bradyrhizobium sp. MOS003]|uniref:glycosyltransferase family 4 protein n=1 Tax=Bradyrhizobium sp. MOS003 TaxID=2133946 RepID=UPI001314E5FA|nr:glycosyltransferase family 4 protein [Bradyrhizobium sp. MOS003]
MDLFFTVAEPQAAFLREFLKLSSRRVKFVWDQTDTRFFTPGAASPKTRPCIVSVGLERRDYTTLAKATSDLDIDVCISGFSSDTRSASRAFPEQLPANMTRRFYSWPDLLQLYRNADAVVVTLFPNSYAAGVQGLMEGMACGRPIVATRTKGLEKYLNAPGQILTVEPGSASDMRRAIVRILEDREERGRLAEHAVMLAAERHQLDRYVHEIAASLRELAAGLDDPN